MLARAKASFLVVRLPFHSVRLLNHYRTQMLYASLGQLL